MISKISELIECLLELGEGQYTPSTYKETIAKAEKVLNLVFAIGTQQLIIKQEEKEILGPLISEALEPIQLNIECTRINFESWLGAGASRKRCALQFLIDDYSNFPVGSSTLGTKFEEIKMTKIMKILDDIKDKKWISTDSEDDESI